MMRKPHVSVIIPVYNGTNYLAEAINSVFSQSYKDYEIIVVDDGSTDGTWDLMQEFNPRIRGFRKENGGTASALNYGIKHALGDLICWLSHDDMFMPDKLERQTRFMAQNPQYALSYTDYIVIDSRGAELSRRICPWFERSMMLRQLFLTNHIHGCSTMIRKAVFARAGYFSEKLKYTQDLEMWIRILRHFEIGKLSFFSMKGRSHERQDSRQTRNFFLEQVKMYKKVFVDIQQHGWRMDESPAVPIKKHEEFTWFADAMTQNRLVKTRHAFWLPLKYYLKALPFGSGRDKIIVLKKVFLLSLTKMKEWARSSAIQGRSWISTALKGSELHAQAKKLIATGRFFTAYAFSKWNPPSCPACGKRRWKHFLAQPPYWVGYCRECGLGRTMPPRKSKGHRIEPEKLSCEENFPERLRSCAPFSDHSFRSGLQAVVEAGLHEGRLLYIGCGFSSFFRLTHKTNFAVQGMELFRNFAPCGYELFKLDAGGEVIGPWPEKNARFDGIMCWNVLEHVAQPMEFLGLLSMMLLPNGIVLIRTPGFSFTGKKSARGSMKRYLQREYPLDLPQRSWLFSNASFARILENAGFAVLQRISCQHDEHAPVAGENGSSPATEMEDIDLAREMIFLCRKRPDPSLGQKHELQGHP